MLTVNQIMARARANMGNQDGGSTGQKCIGVHRENVVFRILRRPTISDPILTHYFGKSDLLRRFSVKIVEVEWH